MKCLQAIKDFCAAYNLPNLKIHVVLDRHKNLEVAVEFERCAVPIRVAL